MFFFTLVSWLSVTEEVCLRDLGLDSIFIKLNIKLLDYATNKVKMTWLCGSMLYV